MSKKSIKIISTLFTVALILVATSSVLLADYTPGNVNANTSVNGISNVTTMGENILGVIQVIGTILAVGILMILGIKYMMGSAEEKASYKKTMVPYVVGAVLIFAASNLAQYVYEFTQTI